MGTKTNTFDTIIFSPHLDDAVFSCGGLMIKKMEMGERILVINIFTSYSKNIKNNGIVLNDERLEEERKVSTLLGYYHQNLGELDAFCRRKKYKKMKNLFGKPLKIDKGDYTDHLKEKICAILNIYHAKEIYVPLGIGWHVDHVLITNIFLNLKMKNVFYYEDSPYCFLPYYTKYRLNDLGLASSFNIDNFKRVFSQWREIITVFKNSAIIKNINNGFYKFLAIVGTSYYFFKIAKQKRNQTKRIDMTSKQIDISELIEAKIELMSRYKSQFTQFFQNEEDYKNLCSSSLKPESKTFLYYERYWQISN